MEVFKAVVAVIVAGLLTLLVYEMYMISYNGTNPFQ